MIRIFLGNLGSGKSANAVRELCLDYSGRKTYTNLLTHGIPDIIHIKPDYVIKKVIKDKKTSFDLNSEFWQKQKKPLNILWDEIHLTANSRMSMTKINMVLSRFIAMARRITGFDKRGYGHLTFIAQKERTIDVNIKDLANEIIYHVAHWVIRCEECGSRVAVNSDMQQIERCIRCGSWAILKENLQIEILKFNEWNKFYAWSQGLKGKFYFNRYMITDIEEYFGYYDTLQMTDMWESYINQN